MKISPNDVVRFLLELFALFSFAFWGYYAWPFPLPSIFFIIGLPAFAAVVWALFRAPKAKIPLDPVGRALVEIFIMGGAAATWLMLDYPVVAGVFAAIALVSGIINARAEKRREGRSA